MPVVSRAGRTRCRANCRWPSPPADPAPTPPAAGQRRSPGAAAAAGRRAAERRLARHLPEGTRAHTGAPQAFKAGLYHLAEQFPDVRAHPDLDRQRAARDAQGRGRCRCPSCAPSPSARRSASSRGEDKRAFLDRARAAVMALRSVWMERMRWRKLLNRGQQVAFLFVVVFGAAAGEHRGLRCWLARAPQRPGTTSAGRRALAGSGCVAHHLVGSARACSGSRGRSGAAVRHAAVRACSPSWRCASSSRCSPTRRADHRALILAFFVVLPLQFCAGRDGARSTCSRCSSRSTPSWPSRWPARWPTTPGRFLERNSKIQWGIMVCVYGLSHAPALLLLELSAVRGRGAFLVFFLVVVVACVQVAQADRRPAACAARTAAPRAASIQPLASGTHWPRRGRHFRRAGIGGDRELAALLYWITPFKLRPGARRVAARLRGRLRTLGRPVRDEGAQARRAASTHWGTRGAITGAVGLLDRVAALCFAAPVFFHSVRWYFGALDLKERRHAHPRHRPRLADHRLRRHRRGRAARWRYVASGTIKTSALTPATCRAG